MYRVLGHLLCDFDSKVKIKGQIIYLIENASPVKQLQVAIGGFVCPLLMCCMEYCTMFRVTLI